LKLICGLGNPGSRYQGTRHNVGFDVIDEVARRRGLTFESSPVEAVVARTRGPGAAVMLVKPLTFMNLSGQAVRGLTSYFRIGVGDILVVTDDVNLPVGRLRGRVRGSEGGHNGLRSVIDELGTNEFARLRIGVGRGDDRWDLADHVLARFEDDERELIATAVSRAADAVDTFVMDGIEVVMNRFNRAGSARRTEDDDESEPA
jgi:PTH1 family peptidyl-tRNA hydrolase